MIRQVAIPREGRTQLVAVSGVSAQSAPITAHSVLLTYAGDAICFCVRGSSPTATTAGVPLMPGQQYRASGPFNGERIAFVLPALGAGMVYITPES